MRQVIELYKRGIDKSILKETLKQSQDERLKQAQELLNFAVRLRNSNPKRKINK